MSTEQIKQKKIFHQRDNNKKITNASQGKNIVSCKDLRRRFWASTLKAEVTGTMPLRFKRN